MKRRPRVAREATASCAPLGQDRTRGTRESSKENRRDREDTPHASILRRLQICVCADDLRARTWDAPVAAFYQTVAVTSMGGPALPSITFVLITISRFPFSQPAGNLLRLSARYCGDAANSLAASVP